MKALEQKRKRSVLGDVQVRRQGMEPQEWAGEADLLSRLPWAVRGSVEKETRL